VEGDIPWMANLINSVGHSGKHACFRCALNGIWGALAIPYRTRQVYVHPNCILAAPSSIQPKPGTTCSVHAVFCTWHPLAGLTHRGNRFFPSTVSDCVHRVCLQVVWVQGRYCDLGVLHEEPRQAFAPGEELVD